MVLRNIMKEKTKWTSEKEINKLRGQLKEVQEDIDKMYYDKNVEGDDIQALFRERENIIHAIAIERAREKV